MMFRSVKFGRHVPILFAFAATLVSCENSAPPPAEATPEVKALHEKRIETFRELVAIAESHFKDGRAPSTNVLEARRDLLAAQLEATSDPTERIALREGLVENLKQFEAEVEAQVKVGNAPQSNLLEVRAARIMAEIKLAEEKS